MTRRRKDEGFFDDLYEMLLVVPSWVGPPLALLFFLVLRFLIPAIFGGSEKPGIGTVIAGVAQAVALPVAGLVLFMWLLAEFQKWRRRRLLDAQTGLNSIRDLSWRQFEHLVGEAYRRQGHVVQETGGLLEYVAFDYAVGWHVLRFLTVLTVTITKETRLIGNHISKSIMITRREVTSKSN